MKKTLTIIISIAIVICASTQTIAQQLSFVAHAGIAFPTGQFGNDDVNKDKASGATIGFCLGGQALYPLNKTFSIIGSAEVCMNTLKSGYKDDIEKLLNQQFGNNLDIKWQKYFNIPIMAGAEFKTRLNNKLDFFGNAGLGPDFLILSKQELESQQATVVRTAKVSTQLGFKLGGGLTINEKYKIGFHYASLGEHRVKIEQETTVPNQPSQKASGTAKLPVSMFTLTLGYVIK